MANAYDMLILWLDIDRKSFSYIEKTRQEVSSKVPFRLVSVVSKRSHANYFLDLKLH